MLVPAYSGSQNYGTASTMDIFLDCRWETDLLRRWMELKQLRQKTSAPGYFSDRASNLAMQ